MDATWDSGLGRTWARFHGEVRREADRLKRSISILISFGFEIRLKPQTKKASHVLA